MLKYVKILSLQLVIQELFISFAPLKANMGKSYTASSLRILQDGNVAKVVGCSGAM